MRVVRRFIACFQTDEAGVAVGYLPIAFKDYYGASEPGDRALQGWRLAHASLRPRFGLQQVWHKWGHTLGGSVVCQTPPAASRAQCLIWVRGIT